jgi:hypothetical protein
MLDTSLGHPALVSSIVLPILHDPLSKVSDEVSHDQRESDQSQLPPTPISSLQTLHSLLLAIDPAPSLLSSLLSPILPSLYSLHAHLSKMGVADPVLKEDVWTLMRTWGRVVEEGEGVQILWSLVEENEDPGGWEGGSAENLKRTRRCVLLLLIHLLAYPILDTGSTEKRNSLYLRPKTSGMPLMRIRT